MKKVFYFVNRSGVLRPTGEEYAHWDVSFNEYSSKRELQREKSRGGCTLKGRSVRMDEIYTPEELIEAFSKPRIENILKEIARYRPDLVNKARQQAQKSTETAT